MIGELGNDAYHRKHMFIVIEGVDGVGKTSVARELAAQLGAVYFRTPSDTLESFQMAATFQSGLPLRQYADQQAYCDPKVRFAFYVFAVIEASVHVERLLQHSSVVCDRFLSSTLAYHRVLAPELATADVSWAQTIKPDLEILLDINDEHLHLQRLRSRTPRSDRLLERNFRFLQLVRHEFHRLDLITLDTSYEGVSQVVAKIKSMIGCSACRQ